jgi:hypothetical protein
LLTTRKKTNQGSLGAFDPAQGDPAEMHFSTAAPLKMQSANNGSPLWWPRSHAAPAGLAKGLVGRNRFIAPIGRAPPIPSGSGASGDAKWRNKAIAPYDLHFASFNFTNKLICTATSNFAIGHPAQIPTAPYNPRAMDRRYGGLGASHL